MGRGVGDREAGLWVGTGRTARRGGPADDDAGRNGPVGKEEG